MATTTITVLDIMDRTTEDLLELFAASGSTSVLLDYVDRIHAMIVGQRRWDWLLSSPQKFMTELGRSDYWLGATGSQSAGEVDTALNITDLRRVKQSRMFSRTGYQELSNTDEAPLTLNWQNRDATYNQGPPKVFRNDEGTPNVLSLYPAPDEGNSYEIVPYPPILTTAAGGSLSARTYFVRLSFLDEENNESTTSNPAARQFIEASKLITVKSPVAPISAGTSGIRYNQYNVYASTTEGSETLQNASPTAVGVDWTEPTGGLITTGAVAPTSSSIEPLRGYIIEFRYYKAHSELATTASVLLIPDEFRDVVVAGVIWLALGYLRHYEIAEQWKSIFTEGYKRLAREQNLRVDFMYPDVQSQGYQRQFGGLY